MENSEAVQKAIQRLQAKDDRSMFEESPKALAVVMRDRSERELLILLGSVLEERLKQRIDSYFAELSPRKGIMTEGGGSARTFGQRISLAARFDLISQTTRLLADLLREMRNYAAHHLGPVDFDTPAISQAAKVYVAPYGWPEDSYLRRLRLISRTFFLGVFEYETGRYEELDWES